MKSKKMILVPVGGNAVGKDADKDNAPVAVSEVTLSRTAIDNDRR